MAAPRFTAALLAPRHWGSWLLVGLAWLLAHLPYRVAIAAGFRIGDLIRRRTARREHITAVNLRLCYPALSASEREQLNRDSFRSLGAGVIETAMSWWLPDRRIRRLIAEVDGLEHLQRAQADGRGVILLTVHFTTAELGVRMLNLLAPPVHPMYRVHENPVLRHVMLRSFDRYLESSIARDDVRAMLRCLKAGEAVWYAPDQDYRRRNRVFVPFFGVQAGANPATGRFADMGNALVIPYFPQRLPGNRGYRLTLLPPLENFPGDDEMEDTARIYRIIEDIVRRQPDQYLWSHRRFRSRPEGEPDYYEK